MIQEENKFLYKVSEYAKLKGLTTQAVYKQVDKKQIEFVKRLINEKEQVFIVCYSSLEEAPKEVEQPTQETVEQPQNNAFLDYLIAENKRLTEQNAEVLEQNKELQNKVVSLAEELSQIARNSQMITSQAQTLHLAEKTQTAEEQEENFEREEKKRGFFSRLFKK